MIYTLFFLLLSPALCVANDTSKDSTRTPYPNVGEHIPDYVFTDLVNYSSNKVAITDFRGKWLILDFWGYSCSACLNSFPKMNKLHREFKDKVQIIMVGATKSRTSTPVSKIEAITKNVYDRLDKKYDLDFTVAFDSILYLKYDVGALPHIFVVDPNGIIRAKTISVDSDMIKSFLNGETPEFERAFSYSESRSKVSYNKNLPLLTSGKMANGGNDTSFLFRSILVKGSEGHLPWNAIDISSDSSMNVQNGMVELLNYDVRSLYKIAYFGRVLWGKSDRDEYENWSRTVILRTKDSLKLIDKMKRYSYSLIVPKERSSSKVIMAIMQSDLKNYFGYHAFRSKTMVPVFYLKVVDSVRVYKLSSSGGRSEILTNDIPYTGITVKNIPFHEFITRITTKLELNYPLIDGTGFSKNIDLVFRANMLDPKSIESALNELGLAIKRGLKEMDAITITD